MEAIQCSLQKRVLQEIRVLIFKFCISAQTDAFPFPGFKHLPDFLDSVFVHVSDVQA